MISTDAAGTFNLEKSVERGIIVLGIGFTALWWFFAPRQLLLRCSTTRHPWRYAKTTFATSM